MSSSDETSANGLPAASGDDERPEPEKDEGTRPAPQKTILVIEDEPAVNSVITRFLRRAGYQVDSAADGAEGMKMFNRARHDAVVTDIIMPKKNGYEVIVELNQRAPGLPIVVITGFASKATWSPKTMERNGIVALLPKPIEFEALVKIFETAFADQNDG